MFSAPTHPLEMESELFQTVNYTCDCVTITDFLGSYILQASCTQTGGKKVIVFTNIDQ